MLPSEYKEWLVREWGQGSSQYFTGMGTMATLPSLRTGFGRILAGGRGIATPQLPALI